MDKLRGVVAKIFIFTLFGLLILSFAIWGVGDIVRGRVDVPAVAEVGGEAITQEQFRRAFSAEFGRLQRSFGGRLDGETARALGLPNDVLLRMVTRALYDREAAELGMLVTDAQARNDIFANPAFRGPLGEFDRLRFEQALLSSNLNEAGYVAALKADLQRAQILSALTGGLAVPDTLTEALFAYQEETRTADYLAVTLDSIPAPAAPDEATLAEFYEQASGAFMAPEYRALTVISLRPEDLFAEIRVDDAELRADYEARLNEFSQPERRTLQQMLFEDEAAATAAYDRLRSGGDFAAVAEELTGEAPLDLGSVTRLDMVPELADAAFALEDGTVSAPVESAFGWHVLKLDGIEPGVVPTFESLQAILREDIQRREAIDALVSIANQLDDELGAGATLEEAAQTLNLAIISVEAIDRRGNGPAGDTLLAGLPDPEVFLGIAFEAELGVDSLVTETEAGGYFVLRVDSVTPPAVRPLEAVREQAIALWTAQERERLARERAEALLTRIEGGERLADVAAAEDLEVRTTDPLTRFDDQPSAALAGALFTLDRGKATLAEGNGAMLVAVLTEITAATTRNAEAAQVEAVQEQARRGWQGDMLALYGRALEDRYTVTINQALIDETLIGF